MNIICISRNVLFVFCLFSSSFGMKKIAKICCASRRKDLHSVLGYLQKSFHRGKRKKKKNKGVKHKTLLVPSCQLSEERKDEVRRWLIDFFDDNAKPLEKINVLRQAEPDKPEGEPIWIYLPSIIIGYDEPTEDDWREYKEKKALYYAKRSQIFDVYWNLVLESAKKNLDKDLYAYVDGKKASVRHCFFSHFNELRRAGLLTKAYFSVLVACTIASLLYAAALSN